MGNYSGVVGKRVLVVILKMDALSTFLMENPITIME